MPFANYSTNKWTTPTNVMPEKDYDIGKVHRSIENARRRIEDAGFNPGDADSRNWFEKLTNLPEGQNFFFDMLDLLDRPANAIRNVLNQGENSRQTTGQAFLRGLAGRDRVRGADLVENIGVESGVGKAVLGTGADILLDPINFIPGGAIAKGVGSISKPVGQVAKSGYRAVENVAPRLREFRENTAQPGFSRFKDALGRGFVPDYKLDETLYGTKDDTLIRAKQAAENDMRYRSEETMKNIADAAKMAGGIEAGTDVGRIMEAPLKQFDELGNELIRPQREIPTDPNVRRAAENLVATNQAIREWARSNGININELEGYMTHVLSREERKRRKNKQFLDRGNFGTGQPNKSILKQREIPGSVEDINEAMRNFGRIEEGENFFEPNAFFATAIGQKRLIEYVNAVNFRKQVLTNRNFAIPYDELKATGQQLPHNAVIIDTNKYKFLREGDDSLKELGITDEIGGEYVVTKSVKQALDRYQKLTTDDGIKGFIKAFDAAQGFWKRAALFSIPYHVRNAVGGMFNNWVGGMNSISLTKYTTTSYKDVFDAIFLGKESKLYKEYRKEGLGSSALSQVEFARAGTDPEKAIQRTIERRSKDTKGKVFDRMNPINAFETSREVGDFIDQVNRFALYKWARDKGMTADQAAKKVRTVQFDYTKTTPLEREVFVRLIPFYRWMRNNLPFQIKQFINDPRKYSNINKLRLNLQEAAGIDEENVPDWMKEQFALPITGDGEGSGRFLGFNLPVADLISMSDPMKHLLDSITPMAKLPAELAMNRNFFFDKPIKEFEGQQKQMKLPFGGPEFGVDNELAYTIESLTGQLGRGLAGMLQRPEDVNQDTKFRIPTLGISSLLKEYDADRSRYFEEREKLQQLLDYINYIEQQTGERPRTINEIKRNQ